ncbi:MAG: hypothetical protein KC613_17315 [Myxococcales bacterium]|nr:hypothetical protein [Myxococcales bacterium]
MCSAGDAPASWTLVFFLLLALRIRRHARS